LCRIQLHIKSLFIDSCFNPGHGACNHSALHKKITAHSAGNGNLIQTIDCRWKKRKVGKAMFFKCSPRRWIMDTSMIHPCWQKNAGMHGAMHHGSFLRPIGNWESLKMLFAEHGVSPLPLAVRYTFVLNGRCQERFDLDGYCRSPAASLRLAQIFGVAVTSF
jgi:hypothetical protein